jgi:glyoxylate carboligase
MSKYPKFNDGEGIEVEPGQLLRLACCDCGLVHDIGIALEDTGNFGLAFKRNSRATGQLRRHKFGYLQEKNQDTGTSASGKTFYFNFNGGE